MQSLSSAVHEAAARYYNQRVTAHMLGRYHAMTIETLAGRLTVQPRGAWIALVFHDAYRASLIAPTVNPASGAWHVMQAPGETVDAYLAALDYRIAVVS